MLQSLTVEADKLAAIVNGLKRVLKDADQYGVTADADQPRALQARDRSQRARSRRRTTSASKSTATRSTTAARRSASAISATSTTTTRARSSASCSRARWRWSPRVRTRATRASYAKGIQSLLGRIDIDEQRLEATRAKLEKQALEQAQALRAKIAAEVGALETYAQNLDALDQQARLLVGEIAMKNFALVRDRVKNIVLRADVGIVQQAWEVREEQRVRVRNLQRERAREEQNLNDELREVLDDSEDAAMRTRRQAFLPALFAVLAGVVLPLSALGQAAKPRRRRQPAASAAPRRFRGAGCLARPRGVSGVQLGRHRPCASPSAASAPRSAPKAKKGAPPSPPPTPGTAQGLRHLAARGGTTTRRAPKTFAAT